MIHHAGAAIFIEHPPDASVSHMLEVSGLPDQPIRRAMGKDVDARKVDDLQIGNAMLLEGIEDFLRRVAIDDAAERFLRVFALQLPLIRCSIRSGKEPGATVV